MPIKKKKKKGTTFHRIIPQIAVQSALREKEGQKSERHLGILRALARRAEKRKGVEHREQIVPKIRAPGWASRFWRMPFIPNPAEI